MSGKVLVIDDDPMIRASIVRALHFAHEVTAVGGGREALELLARGERFDVILCDLMMPRMSGMKLHEALAELDAELARRVVFLTGGAFTPAAREFLARVPNRTVEKPFGGAELRAIVQQQLQAIS